MNTQRTFNGLARVAALMVVAMVLVGIWGAFFEQPFLYYQNLPFPTMNAARAGEPVLLSVERCNRSMEKQTYRTTHSIVNASTKLPTILPDVEVDIDPGCHRSISKVNIIPANTPPGTYIVSGVATVAGTFVKHKVEWYSEPFEVIP